MEFQPIYSLPFPLLAGFSGGKVCSLEYTPSVPSLYPPVTEENHAICRRLEMELAEYAAGERKVFTVPLHPSGTAFRLRVWEELRNVPYGEVRSYSEIAASMGGGSSLYNRAVGNACGKNPILILIPCHRITAKNGIGGFSCGLEIKKLLWAIEGISRRE